MTNKQCEHRLAQALGVLRPKTDFNTVAGAMPAPVASTPVSVSRPHRFRRCVAAVAAAAVMVAAVGTWWYTRPEDQPPITDATEKTTTGFVADTTTTTTTGTTADTAGSTDTTGSTPSSTTGGTKAPTTTTPTQSGVTAPDVIPVTSIKEAKSAIAAGRYEDAYLYLLTDTSQEAAALLEKFVYVPVNMTDIRDGKVYSSGNWTYDEMGFPQMESVVNESASGGNQETKKILTYDSHGRVKTKTAITIKEGKEAYRDEYTFTYDAQGNTTAWTMITIKEGKETYWEEYSFVYDVAGRVLRKDCSKSSGYSNQWTRVYTYDARGNCVREELTGQGTHHIVTTTTYNEADQPLVRLESVLDEGSWKKDEYVYDEAGRVLKNAYLTSSGTGWTYTYTYDENGVQTSYSHTLSDEPNHWQKWYMDGTKTVYEDSTWEGVYTKAIKEGDKTEYTYKAEGNTEWEGFYDDNGNLLIYLEWNKVTNTGNYTQYSYDKYGNLEKAVYYSATNRNALEASATFVRVSESNAYVYDIAGRVLEKKHTDFRGKVTTYVYAYDAVGRITKDGKVSSKGVFVGTEYTYNVAGLILTQKETYSATSWNCVTNTYDKNGRKIRIERTKSDGTWSIVTYDAAGNLLRWEDNTGLVYAYTWELRYYPDGLTEDHRKELEAFRDAAIDSEIGDPESGIVDE